MELVLIIVNRIRGLGCITELADYSRMLFKELYFRQDS